MPVEPAVIFEDAHLLAINKPSGMLTEGGGERESDLEQWASEYAGREVRCCHRLDRLTSGVLLMRKKAQFKRELAEAFSGGRARKQYWAIVEGEWDKRLQRIETRIAASGPGIWANVQEGGKSAVSTFRLRENNAKAGLSWLSVILKTGRTHQARLHCLYGGCPVAGDPLYGTGKERPFFGLHARELRVKHPEDGRSLSLQAEPPAEWSGFFESFS